MTITINLLNAIPLFVILLQAVSPAEQRTRIIFTSINCIILGLQLIFHLDFT
jgi:hypothetical protein